MPKRIGTTLDDRTLSLFDSIAKSIYKGRSARSNALKDAIKDWIEKNKGKIKDKKLLEVPEVIKETKEIDKITKQKIKQILQSSKKNPKQLAEDLSISNYKLVMPYLEELFLKGKIVSSTGKPEIRFNTKLEWKEAVQPSEYEITYNSFFTTLVREYENWIMEFNPHRSTASIPALRELVCKDINIPEDKFDSALLELHKLRLIWLSEGIGSNFTGKPIITKLGRQMYAITIHKKQIPTNYSNRILGSS